MPYHFQQVFETSPDADAVADAAPLSTKNPINALLNTSKACNAFASLCLTALSPIISNFFSETLKPLVNCLPIKVHNPQVSERSERAL